MTFNPNTNQTELQNKKEAEETPTSFGGMNVNEFNSPKKNRITFNPKTIRAGLQNKKEAEETPTSFGDMDGDEFNSPKKNRMAGPGGAFAIKMMQNPQLAESNAEWNRQFIQSNPGRDFYHSKIEMGVG